jgi:sodium-independent sulfate anion transporter 11
VITPPSQVYEFWRISPLDFSIFFIGVFVTIFIGIQEGIFATIALSAIVLISGIFNARGKFLGSVRIQHIPGGSKESESLSASKVLESSDPKRVYLSLDRRDGSNPLVDLEKPFPGIFVYRFTAGFNYANAANQVERMMEAIYAQTKQTTSKSFENKGVGSAL